MESPKAQTLKMEPYSKAAAKDPVKTEEDGYTPSNHIFDALAPPETSLAAFSLQVSRPGRRR